MLRVNGIAAGYGGRDVIEDISFSINPGSFTCVLGANGCGKTTLLKTVLGLIKPSRGAVFIDDKNIHSLTEKEVASRLAYIPQAHTPPFPFTVEDVVLMGRTPYLSALSRVSEEDRQAATQAMEKLDITHMAKRKYTDLSGGQRQMVIIARALAQEPQVMVMDEPTASLDFGNQYIVLEQMTAMTELGISVLMVTHDPDHALYCADQVLLMRDGLIIGHGAAAEVIDEQLMYNLYHTRVK
ncbi:MAG: ABC transporter ATP-binding protein, partial [Clostridiales bacterium]